MTPTSKPSEQRWNPSIGGIRIDPILIGSDGAVVGPDAGPPRVPSRVVSISLCSRSKSLRMTFQACGFTYTGRPGTEDPLDAALIGAAVRDAIEARLVAVGVVEACLAVRHLKNHRDATPTRRSDLSLMKAVIAAMVRSAPRAVAEATTGGRCLPPWSARPIPAAVYRALD